MSEFLTRSQKIAQRLKETRTQFKFTQQQLADKLGIKQQTYGGYESGRHEPNIDLLIEIANLFEVSMDYLTHRDEPEEEFEAAIEEQEKKEEEAFETMLKIMEERKLKRQEKARKAVGE
jgi:transcriptional regulator with XRE-family HTH domain